MVMVIYLFMVYGGLNNFFFIMLGLKSLSKFPLCYDGILNVIYSKFIFKNLCIRMFRFINYE